MADAHLPRSISICRNPNGEGSWFEDDRPGEWPCHIVGCDCVPARYVLAEPTDEMVEPVALDLFADSWTASPPAAETAAHLWERSSEDTRGRFREHARRLLRLAFSTSQSPEGDQDGTG